MPSRVTPSAHWRVNLTRSNYWQFPALNPFAPNLRPHQFNAETESWEPVPASAAAEVEAELLGEVWKEDPDWATRAQHEHACAQYKARVEAGDETAAIEFAANDPWALRADWFVQYCERLAALDQSALDRVFGAWKRGSALRGKSHLRETLALIRRDIRDYELMRRSGLAQSNAPAALDTEDAVSERNDTVARQLFRNYHRLERAEGLELTEFLARLTSIADQLQEAISTTSA